MENLAWFCYSTGYLAVGIVLLFVAKKIFDIATPYSIDVQLTEKDNPAVGVLLTGFLLGITAVLCGVFVGDTPDPPTVQIFVTEMTDVLLYAALGIVLLFIAGVVNDKLVLNTFSNRKEIIENNNTAVGAVMAFSYVSAGFVIAGATYGSTDIVSALIMFILGQGATVVFAKTYQVVTRYDDQAEIGRDNLAAGLAFGGNLLAYGMIMMKGAAISPQKALEWTLGERLLQFVYYAVAGCVLLVLGHLISDRVFLPKARIADEIMKDRNTNAGLIETGLSVSIGAVLVFCL